MPPAVKALTQEPHGVNRGSSQIYYGSFMVMYIDASPAQIKKKLREVVLHELRHHIEGLCGIRDLAIEDDAFVQKALAQLGKNSTE